MAANPNTVRAPTPRPAQAPAAKPAASRPQRQRPPVSKWRKLYNEWGAFGGLLLASAVLLIGYYGRESRRIFADEGLGYALGIVGSLLILTLLVYPLRKRVRLLRFIGPVKNWFRVHMMLGVIGPIAILYHANFALGSVNSTAALFSMLLVASSGLVGRFLYSKIHRGLYGRKTSLKELLQSVRLSTAETGGAAQFVPHLMEQIAQYDRQVLKTPKSLLQCSLLPIRLAFQTRRGYRKITSFVGERLDEQSVVSPAVAQHKERLQAASNAFVREHLKRVRKVAAFAAYERLFALWHKVHLPFFYLLLVTAIVHVVAVHVYAI